MSERGRAKLERNLVVGGWVILALVGGGLIAVLYGGGAAAVALGVVALSGGLGGFLWLILSLLQRWASR